MARSRVRSGTLWTMLVAAMSSSAGSPWKSRRVEAMETARSIGHTSHAVQGTDHFTVVEVESHPAKLNQFGQFPEYDG